MRLAPFFIFWIFIIVGCSNSSDNSNTNPSLKESATPQLNYSVTAYYVHDTSLFTEGLLFHNGQLFESTGSPEDLPHTRSLIGISDLATGKFSPKIEIDRDKYFGVGIVFLNNKLFQLTYENQTGFIYDASTFKPTGQFSYSNKEGWGLTTDGKFIIMSDGTDKLTYLDPVKMVSYKTVPVSENGIPLEKINELEFINGHIYANIYTTDDIVKIDPSNGKVVGRINLSSLVHEARIKNPNAEVLNGIAYDSVTDRIFVTGKMWANIYEIKFPH